MTTNDDYRDCKNCRHSTQAYSALLCLAENLPKPVAFMRDPRSSCGYEGALYEEKTKYEDIEK